MGKSFKLVTQRNITVGDTSKLKCNTCLVETNHQLRAAYVTIHYSGDYDANSIWEERPPYYEKCQYRLWMCLGCETACLQKAILETSDTGPITDDELTGSAFYPQRVCSSNTVSIRSTKEYASLDKKLAVIYREIITAFNQGLLLMCAIGLRALLEGICIERGIEDWTLNSKLKKLETLNILPANIIDGLRSFKFMGDDAAHRLEMSSKQELDLAIDVVEDVLNLLYEVNYRLMLSAKKLVEHRDIQVKFKENIP